MMQKTILFVEDAHLVAKFAQGDTAAMQALVIRHKDKVFTSIYHLLRDEHLAEDIFQETFLKIISIIKNGKYNEQGKFLAYAQRIAHNLCIDHFRKLKSQASITLADGSDIAQLVGKAHSTAQPQHREHREGQAQIAHLLQNLNQEQRQVILLRIYGELSFKEIAETTGVSINTALGRMRYALANLRKMMQESQITLR